jgi:hypothetical protein
MHNHDGRLTPKENDHIRLFLDLFADVEQLLKKRLRVPLGKHTEVGALIQDYLKLIAYWERHAREVDQLRLIRNFLTHERNPEDGNPVAVTTRCVQRLQEIRKSLDAAVPIISLAQEASNHGNTQGQSGRHPSPRLRARILPIPSH